MQDIILSKFGDHGAESSRRDKFQNHYAVFWCIKMLTDDSITEIICEYGEDLVINRNGHYELYQVKTKQESVNNWRLNELIPIIAKTFAMVPYFNQFGTVSKCCFISNKEATGQLYELKELVNQSSTSWNVEEKHSFEEFCKNNSENILAKIKQVDPENDDTVTDVNHKLLLLKLDTNFHHLEYLADTSIRKLRQILENNYADSIPITYTDIELDEVYDRIMLVVDQATIAKTREEKAITKTQLENCLRKPLHRQTRYKVPTQQEIERTPGKTTLERKLTLGGFRQPFIESALELKINVKYQSRGWDFGGSGDLLKDINFRIKYLYNDMYDKVCATHPSKQDLGRNMLEEVKKELPALIQRYAQENAHFVDDLFLMGIAWDLTSQCQIYWSQQLS